MIEFCKKCNSEDLGVKTGLDHNGRQRRRCNSCGRKITVSYRPAYNPDDVAFKGVTSPEEKSAPVTSAKDHAVTSRVHVVSSAQNFTPADQEFVAALESYCRIHGAQMHVIKTRYKNPDAFHAGEEPDAYDSILEPYLLDDDLELSPRLVIAGRLRVNATAAAPLSGLDDVHGTKSAIYGHAQLQLRMIPTPHGELPKMIRTSGALTEKSFSSSKAGQKADFHHSKAAIVVEILPDWNFITRELSWCGDQGCFQDLDTIYYADGTIASSEIDALVLGDEHVEFEHEETHRATFGERGIVERLRPKMLVRHDMHDQFSASHHHEGDPFVKARKAVSGRDDVEAELMKSVERLRWSCEKGIHSVIVDSNHHDHLGKWLSRFDADRDPKNILTAWELFGMLSKDMRAGGSKSAFELFVRDRLGPELSKFVEFSDANTPLMLHGIDMSQHGHIGPNGSRGGPRGFGSSAYKLITGHTHTPGIERGVWTVGTSVPHMPYARGYSSWMTTHCAVYTTGKRALIHIVGGVFTTLKSPIRKR